MPVFALANAGVPVTDMGLGAATDPVTLGVVAGLVLGKPLGILGCVWIAVKLGLADLPDQVGWLQILAVGCLGGIGFTMALFIGGLAFDGGASLQAAKIGIVVGSIVAGIAGAIALQVALAGRTAESGAVTPLDVH